MTSAIRFRAGGAGWVIGLALVATALPSWPQAASAPAAAPAPAVAGSASPAPSAPPTREQVERRVTSATFLVEQSSAARQVDSGGNAEAKQRREKARQLLTDARAALAAGDVAQAHKLVDGAARTMMEAVRMSAPDQITAGKERSDFEARLTSTRALLEAQQRIAAEKGAGARNAELMQRIEGMVAEAQKLATAGNLKEARRMLDQAYGASRAAIGGLRGGDTLVRSLNFASKEEEYAYEIDRNDTHKMLVQVLLQDKRSASTDAMVERALKTADDLRKQAEQQASRKEFDSGVRSLEESTKELVRAIRAAGVFIPG
jgi:hypothetical protein